MKKIKYNEIRSFLDNGNNNAEYIMEEEGYITTMSSLQELEEHSICWIKKRKNLTEEIHNRLKNTNDIIVVAPFYVDGADCIITDYPKGVFFSILNNFFSSDFERTISSDARIYTDKIGENVHIGDNCYIGKDVVIGDNTIIHPNVSVICPCSIGHDCEIYPGVVIGADGYGYYFDEDIPYREKHFRGVRIGNYVDIGSNTCIDRGLITDTVIKDNVKIDNLCHISHNVIIEDNCLVIVGTIICGSAHIKKNSYLSPGSVVLNQVVVEENSKVGANSLAVNRVKAGTTILGVPGKKYSI